MQLGHVAIISPEYPPYAVRGLGTHVQQLARGLSASGCKAHVFSAAPGPGYSYQDQNVFVSYVSLAAEDGVSPYGVDVDADSRLNLRVAEAARQHFARLNGRPSVIHVHDWYGFEAADWLRTWSNAPVITTLHALHAVLFRLFQISVAGNRFITMEEHCCRQSDRVIALSNSVAEDLKSVWSIPPPEVDVVWNGFDVENFVGPARNRDEVAQFAASLLKYGERAIVFAGRLAGQKGVLPLLRSARQVLTQIKGVRYLIAGAGK